MEWTRWYDKIVKIGNGDDRRQSLIDQIDRSIVYGD